MSVRRFAADLREIFLRRLTSLGMRTECASVLVEGLLDASLRGIDTHGIRLLPLYAREFEGGRAKLQPELSWSWTTPTTAVLEADSANGVIAASIAMQQAILVAREHGIAMVVIKNSNHFAAASIYTLMAARRGLIGLSLTNSDALVAPHLGRRPMLGTNPIAIAAAASDGFLFDLDMATSQVAYSRVLQSLNAGREIPAGWAVERADNNTGLELSTDGLATLLPLGGYKGQGLGMMVHMLTALLAGMPSDDDISNLYVEPFDEPRRIAHTLICIDPSRFLVEESFAIRLNQYLRRLRGMFEGVMIPGDLEALARSERERVGIPLSDKEIAWIG